MDQLEKMIAPYIEQAPVYAQNLVFAIVIFLVGRLIALQVKKISISVMRKSKVDETLVGFGSSLGYFGLLALVVVAAINRLGVETTSFVAILGAAGLAVGLALQGSLSNFAAGALMIMFKPIKVGDFVEGAGVSGEVMEISIFTTVLKTPDGKKVIVPNSKISSDNIINYSALGTRRLELNIGISYSCSIDNARSVIMNILKSEPRVLTEPEPIVGVVSLGENSVNMVVRPWVNSADFGPVTLQLNQQIKESLEQNGITIPFPQREVRVIYESPKPV